MGHTCSFQALVIPGIMKEIQKKPNEFICIKSMMEDIKKFLVFSKLLTLQNLNIKKQRLLNCCLKGVAKRRTTCFYMF